jgi:hypothetical protein
MITHPLEETRVILTLEDVASEYDAVKNEEIVFANELKYIGANSASEAFFIGILEDDINKEDFTNESEQRIAKSSEVYGDMIDQAYVSCGEIKGYPAFVVSDGMDEFVYVGPNFKMNLL